MLLRENALHPKNGMILLTNTPNARRAKTCSDERRTRIFPVVSMRLFNILILLLSIATINDGKLIMKFDGEQAAPEGAAFALGLKEVA